MNNKRTTTEQQVNTNKNDKNIKNERNNINKKQKSFDDVFAEMNFSKELENTLKDFIDMRKAIKKPMTTKALELLIKNLNKLTNLDAEKIEILNQSIEHSWQTVYPLKQENNKNKKSAVDEWLKREEKRQYKDDDFNKLFANQGG